MTVGYEMDSRGFILIAPAGRNTVDDYVSAFRQISRDEQCRGINKFLFDSRRVEVSLSAQQLSGLGAMMVRRHDPDRKIAVVVQTDLHFGITRMYQSFSEDDSLRIFSVFDEATAWLIEQDASC